MGTYFYSVFLLGVNYVISKSFYLTILLTGAGEYTDCTSAEG